MMNLKPPTAFMGFVLMGLLMGATAGRLSGQDRSKYQQIERLARSIEVQAVGWRQSIHKNPELGNREFRTAALVATHLRSLGCSVDTGVGHTGVIGVLKGTKPGPVVSLRAEMDALPVTEEVNIPFASKARTVYNGRQTGIMHACGHDMHTAILMGTAAVLAQMREQLGGTVKFIFQPDEEGTADPAEGGGAQLLLQEGVLRNPTPGAIFALHVTNQYNVGQILFKSGPTKAGGDLINIVVLGRQTHAARPW